MAHISATICNAHKSLSISGSALQCAKASQLLKDHKNQSLTSIGAKEIRHLDPKSMIGLRPHTISYVRERSYARPLLTAETYEAFGGNIGAGQWQPLRSTHYYPQEKIHPS